MWTATIEPSRRFDVHGLRGRPVGPDQVARDRVGRGGARCRGSRARSAGVSRAAQSSSPVFIMLSTIVSAWSSDVQPRQGAFERVGIIPATGWCEPAPPARRRPSARCAAGRRRRASGGRRRGTRLVGRDRRAAVHEAQVVGVGALPAEVRERRLERPAAERAASGARSSACHSAPGQKPRVHPPWNRSVPSAPTPSGKRPRGVTACNAASRCSSSARRSATALAR